MKSKVIEYLNSLVSESTPKAELDLIEFAKKCVRAYQEKEPKKKESFVPPTKEEVASYVKSMGYNVDVDTFYTYYTNTKWHDKNGKIVKNWKNKTMTWSIRSGNKVSQPQAFIHNNYTSEQIQGLLTNLDEVEV